MKTMIKMMAVLMLVPCMAHAENRWQVQVGVNRIAPQVTSGDLSAPSLPGTQIDVEAANSAIITLGYAYTDNLSVEIYGGLPYQHDIVGDGAIAGVGKIGETRQISPTVMLQYYFGTPDSGLRPYVGAGLTYAYFYDERGTNVLTSMTNPGGDATLMKIDSAFGFSFQAGLQYNLSDRWYLDAGVIKTLLKTTSHLSTGQHIDTDLDPLSTNISVGYRF